MPMCDWSSDVCSSDLISSSSSRRKRCLWLYGAPARATPASSVGKPLSAHPPLSAWPIQGHSHLCSKTEFHRGSENRQSHSPDTPQAQERWPPCSSPPTTATHTAALRVLLLWGLFSSKEVKFGHENCLGYFSFPFPAPVPLGPGNPMAPFPIWNQSVVPCPVLTVAA